MRKPNAETRSREYLTPEEIDLLQAGAGFTGRYGYRDATMVLIAFGHGLRVSELVNLKWDQVDLKHGILHVKRIKNGISTPHPLRKKELRALKKLRKDYPSTSYVFTSERGTPVSDSGFRKIVARAGIRAGFSFPIHPHMLRHSCGFKLANDGKDTRSIQVYLGHKNIQNTVRYTELSPNRFKGFWDD